MCAMKKTDLVSTAKNLGIQMPKKMTKKDLQNRIAELSNFPETSIAAKILKIYHLADIHIRDSRRHPEFSAVFDATIAEIAADPTDRRNKLIIVAGDIFDEGSKRTPSVESMLIIQKWFARLAELGFVIVFPGNHDFRESNTDILEGLIMVTNKIDNLIYLRDSRHIIFNNITLTHSSLIDKKFIPAPPSANRALNLAIYHGTIGGSAHTGHSTRFRRESEFKNFNAVLLGDIHIPDVWIDDNNVTFGYPGSIVQQNHGETVTDHGMLVWTISDTSSAGKSTIEAEFIEIPNSYAHITISPGTDPDVSDDIKNVYLRIAGDVPDSVIEKIRSTKNILEIKYTNPVEIGFVPPTPIMETGGFEDVVVECVTDTDKFHNTHLSVAGAAISKTEIPAQSVWNIDTLTIGGLFAFSDVVNFIMEPGVTLISGQNGYGKTSLINALKYAILHEHDERLKISVRNKHCAEYFTDCSFTVDGNKYIITDYNGNNINFETFNGTKLNGSQITATFKQVEKLIGTDWLQNCIFTLNRENFLQYTSQRRLNEIKKSDYTLALWISNESSARENLKSKKREHDSLTSKLGAFPDYSATIAILEKKYAETMEKIANLNIANATSHISVDTSDKTLAILRTIQKPTVCYDSAIAAEQATKLQALTEKYYSMKLTDSEIIQLNIPLHSTTDNPNEYLAPADWNGVPSPRHRDGHVDIEKRLAEIGNINTKVNYEYMISQLNSRISTLKHSGATQNSRTDELIPENNCVLKSERKPVQKTCRAREDIMKQIDASKSAEINTTEIAEVLANMKKLLDSGSDIIRLNQETLRKYYNALNSLQNPVDYRILYAELNEVEKYAAETLTYNENVEHNRRVRDSLSHYNYVKLAAAESDLKKYTNCKNLCEEREKLIAMSTRNSLKTRLKEQTDIEKQIQEIKMKISEYSKLEIEWNDYNTATEEIECILYTRQLNSRRELENIAQQLKNELDIKLENNRNRDKLSETILATKNSIADLEYYIACCKKITTKLLHSKVSTIGDFVNKFLHGLIPGALTVSLKLNGDDKIDIEFTEKRDHGEIVLGVNSLSGYQSFLYNLAFATAMNKYCAEKSSKFIFIDECISTADAGNVEMLPVLFSRLLTVYSSVNAISHLPSIKKYVKRHIKIEINKNGKRVLLIETPSDPIQADLTSSKPASVPETI